jgi:hypothetical protein
MFDHQNSAHQERHHVADRHVANGTHESNHVARMHDEVHAERAQHYRRAEGTRPQLAETVRTFPGADGGSNHDRSDRIRNLQNDGGRSTQPRESRNGNGDGQLEITPVQDLFRNGKQTAKFDSHKSVEEQIKEGNFKKSDGSDETRNEQKLEKGDAPNIKVVYEDKNTDHPDAPKPDFIVKKDGSVEVVHNPEGSTPDKEIVVQVEREKGETGKPGEKQQAAVDGLVDYLGQRVQAQYGDALKEVKGPDGRPVKQVEIEDNQNLISDKVEQKFGSNMPKEDLVPPEVRNISDQVDRVRGSNGGSHSFPREGVDRQFPPREVPQPVDESNKTAAMKDMTASLFNADKTHPYTTIKHRSDGSYAVGRYGLNQATMGNWMADLLGIDLGDPPDYSKLAEALKKNPELAKKLQAGMAKMAKDGKVSQDFADKFKDGDFAQKFAGFADKLGGNKGEVTEGEVKNFLPKELQETIATNRIENFERQMGIDPKNPSDKDAGRVGLAMHLGHVPNEQEQNNPLNKKYMDAGANMYEIAKGRQTGLGDINVSDAQGKIVAAADGDVGKQMWRRYMSNGNLGCAASVSEVLNQAGFSYAHSAGVVGLRDQLLQHGWKMHRVSEGGAKPGDVIFGINQGSDGRSGGGSGHIGIVGTKGTVYDNSSSTGQWTHHNINNSSWAPGNRRFGPQMWYLTPPGNA